MKKTIAFASVACACAVAFNAFADGANPPYYLDWFQGVGASGESKDVAASADLGPTAGSWTELGTGTKTWSEADGFVFDLDDNQYVTFTADQTAAPDTGTVTRVELTSYFAPVICASASELPSASAMNGKNAQIGFASVAVTNADQTATFAYYAWVGGDSWIPLTGATPNDEEDIETTLVAEFDYRGTNPTVAFSIVTNGTESITNALAYNESAEITITSSAATTQKKVLGVLCDGSGNIKSLTASIAKAIAEIGETKYISLAEAASAAATGSDKVITMLAETPENVELENGTTITNANGYVKGEISADENSTITIALKEEDIGNGASGEYTIPVKTAGSGTVNVTVPLSNKEIALDENGNKVLTTDNGIKVMIQTKAGILADVKPDTANEDKAFAAATAENKSYTNNALRVFLAKYAPDAYTNASASAAGITTALQTTPENANGLALWQDYVLGIAPTDAVKPLSPAAGDGEADSIKFEIPALAAATASGDYTVTYEVYKGETKVSTFGSQTAGAIKIPLTGETGGTGTYTVKAVLAPANN